MQLLGPVPFQYAQDGSHAVHTPAALYAWKPQSLVHWPVSDTTSVPTHSVQELVDADVHDAHGLVHGAHVPSAVAYRPNGQAAKQVLLYSARPEAHAVHAAAPAALQVAQVASQATQVPLGAPYVPTAHVVTHVCVTRSSQRPDGQLVHAFVPGPVHEAHGS